MRKSLLSVGAAGVLSVFLLGLEGAYAQEVPPAVQELRRHMMDTDVSSLTFHNMDQLFSIRSVPRSSSPWHLPKSETPLDFTYEIDGRTKPAEAIFEDNRTNALLIIKRGKIVSEVYRNGTSERSPFVSWSMSKSITATLAGIAVSEGRIKSLDQALTVYLPELKGTGYEGVTIRQALQMRSGVDYSENHDPSHPSLSTEAFEQSIVQNRNRFTDFAKRVKRRHTPGEAFEYKTLDTAVVGLVVERATGMSLSQYLGSHVWEPMGAEADGFFLLDGKPGVGSELSGMGYNAVLRDWGRFGLLMLQDGVVDGRRILPSGWVKEATSPAPNSPIPTLGYGLQWWTVPGSRSYFAWGLGGQFVFVDPATQTVVVKTSYQDPATSDTVGMPEALAFMRAAADWIPPGQH